MKGYFTSPHAVYQLDIQGEGWRQGDPLNITVSKEVKDPNYADQWHITVAHVDVKKLKKDPSNKHFNVVFSAPLTEEIKHFSLDFSKSCPISDGSYATYVLCGQQDDLASSERLELNMSPLMLVQDYINAVELFHRFKHKTIKNKKTSLDVKFDVPKVGKLSTVKQLNMLFTSRDNGLNIDYIFKVNKLEYVNAQMTTKLDKKEFSVSADLKDLAIYGDSFNQDFVNEKTQDVIDKLTGLANLASS